MDTFHDQYIVGIHLQALAAGLTLSRLEVILRQLDLLTAEEGVELLVDLLQIEGIDRLIVIVAIGTTRCLLTVDEIIVE